MLTSRRSFLRGLLAAPAVIAYSQLMPVKLVDWAVTAPRSKVVFVTGLNKLASDGSSWATAYKSLAEALGHIEKGDTVYVSHTHVETIDYERLSAIGPGHITIKASLLDRDVMASFVANSSIS